MKIVLMQEDTECSNIMGVFDTKAAAIKFARKLINGDESGVFSYVAYELNPINIHAGNVWAEHKQLFMIYNDAQGTEVCR